MDTAVHLFNLIHREVLLTSETKKCSKLRSCPIWLRLINARCRSLLTITYGGGQVKSSLDPHSFCLLISAKLAISVQSKPN